MTDGAFTEEDVDNDGLIKREVGKSLNSVLARESGELYSMFREYCQANSLDPSMVLGDMVLRAMRDDGFAQELSGTVVEVGKLKNNDVKRDDLELVNDLIEEFSDDDGGSNGGAIDNLIQQRIEAIGRGPLGGMGQNQGPAQNGGSDVEELKQKIDSLERELHNERKNGGSRQGGSSGESKSDDLDNVFGSSDDDGGVEDDDGGEEADEVVFVNNATEEEDSVDESTFSTEDAEI